MDFPSARAPSEDDLALIDLATRTIDAATDADPPESGEGGAHGGRGRHGR
ncbi:hypothetical protein [Janibacter corallicola]|nr:hypothetical protein [Janibacter corallicola]